MAIEDIKQLKTVNHEGPAQVLLDAGWVLLAVCVCQDGANQYAEYHLGHVDKPEKPKMNISQEALIKAAEKKR